MKDSAFEKLWRQALKDISLYPGDGVWRAVEDTLKKEEEIDQVFKTQLGDKSIPVSEQVWEGISGQLYFEDHIKAELENANLTPPLEIWNKIEAKLDDKDRKPFIIWWQNTGKVAAGIAALLLLALSIPFFLPKPKSSTSEGIKEQSISPKENQVTSILPNKNSSINNSSKNEVISRMNVLKPIENTENTVVAQVEATVEEEEKTVGQTLIELAKNKIEFLEGKPFDPYATSLTLKRNKLPLPLPEEENSRTTGKSWLGFMSGLAPFDPNISISNFESQALVTAGGTPSSLFEYKNLNDNSVVQTETFQIPLSQPFNDVRTGSAVNMGADYGFRLSKRVSFQTGLRYTRGSSFIQSNVYALDKNTGEVRPFLESHYLLNQKSISQNTLISSSTDIRNAYQFVMLPVQLAYHQPIFQKLEASASAGFSGDLLINNVLDKTPEGASKLTPQNSAYRAMNISAVGSVKLHYRVSENWNAMVGGNIQHALRSGVEASQNFSFRPRFIGINYGINYMLDR